MPAGLKQQTDSVTIRALTPDDWQEFAAIRLEALQKYPQFFGSTYAHESAYGKEEWQNWLGDAKGCLFALYDGRTIIGTTGIMTSRDDPSGSTAILIASYIKPEYQGRGLSKKLYDARINWAVAQPQLKTLCVSHREGNEPSRRANQKWGFRFTDKAPKAWKDGTNSVEYHYELDLEQLRKQQ
ncbi:MAG: GNAT family N-acetyltransferase [Alphaproteobacteria bacterium]|nr:GNAT family N-acetyltransferase [Alphaproteobacteria bacterium]